MNTTKQQHRQIDRLAKRGQFEELCRAVENVESLDLPGIFSSAVTDYRTIKRNAGHQQILEWCLDRGLKLTSRAGWLNESIVCLAARNANLEIVESIQRRSLPENPFIRASVGDVDFLEKLATSTSLSSLWDDNGFNLLFSCAGSGLGRCNEDMKNRLTRTCQFLLEQNVDPNHQIEFALLIFPIFLCASSGGNESVLKLLLDQKSLSMAQFQQALEHALEPHQRSGAPFYEIAKLLLSRHSDDLNQLTAQGRTLLHGAANRGSVKPVKWLLEKGANPNSLDTLGRTPLHVAAERNTSTTVIKLLIESGTDAKTKDHSGKMALDYAREKNRIKVIQFLKTRAVDDP